VPAATARLKDPEARVSAMVVCHPEATSFSVAESLASCVLQSAHVPQTPCEREDEQR